MIGFSGQARMPQKQAKWMAVGGACVLLAAAAHARCGPGMAIQLRPKKEIGRAHV